MAIRHSVRLAVAWEFVLTGGLIFIAYGYEFFFGRLEMVALPRFWRASLVLSPMSFWWQLNGLVCGVLILIAGLALLARSPWAINFARIISILFLTLNIGLHVLNEFAFVGEVRRLLASFPDTQPLAAMHNAWMHLASMSIAIVLLLLSWIPFSGSDGSYRLPFDWHEKLHRYVVASLILFFLLRVGGALGIPLRIVPLLTSLVHFDLELATLFFVGVLVQVPFLLYCVALFCLALGLQQRSRYALEYLSLSAQFFGAYMLLLWIVSVPGGLNYGFPRPYVRGTTPDSLEELIHLSSVLIWYDLLVDLVFLGFLFAYIRGPYKIITGGINRPMSERAGETW